MKDSQIRGYLFEGIVRKIIESCGYESETDKICGRSGSKHQIDALGEFSLRIPFIYPLELITEAKWHKKSNNNKGRVGLPELRSFTGVLKDLREKFSLGPDIDENELEERKKDRKTHRGCFFSVNGYTTPAEKYAITHGIFLVTASSMTHLNWTKNILEEAKELIDDVRSEYNNDYSSYGDTYREISHNLVDEKININGDKVFLGIWAGYYPILLFSDKELEFNANDPDLLDCESHGIEDREKNIIKFSGNSPANEDKNIYFTLPPSTISEHVKETIKKQKKDKLNEKSIYLPIKIEISEGKEITRVFNLKTTKKPFNERNLNNYE